MNFAKNVSHFIDKPQLNNSHGYVPPVTLSTDFSELTKLSVFAIMSIFGSIGNIFLISSLMIEPQLNHSGNTFIANVALADLLITLLVIPMSVVVIMANLSNSLEVCKIQWFLTVASLLIVLFSIVFISIENRIRLKKSTAAERFLSTLSISAIIVLMWTSSLSLSLIQFVYNFTFDYCAPDNNDLTPVTAVYMVGGVMMFLVTTIIIYLCSILQYRKLKPTPNKVMKSEIDYKLMITNFLSLLLSAICWLPFGIVAILGAFQDVSDQLLYNLAWLALSKSCLNHCVYFACNKYFRNAFVSLFNYCCCKSSVLSQNRRPLRGHNVGYRSKSDVRVHILPGYNMYSSQAPHRYQRAPTRDVLA